ncbi:transcriptional regulator, partial [bacterium]|nr:transcriptional regulator [bacterium]
QSLYRAVGKSASYTKRRGLDSETNKELILRHLRLNKKIGSPMKELQEVLPSLSRFQIYGLLKRLRQEGKIHKVGTKSGSKWYSK